MVSDILVVVVVIYVFTTAAGVIAAIVLYTNTRALVVDIIIIIIIGDSSIPSTNHYWTFLLSAVTRISGAALNSTPAFAIFVAVQGLEVDSLLLSYHTPTAIQFQIVVVLLVGRLEVVQLIVVLIRGR